MEKYVFSQEACGSILTIDIQATHSPEQAVQECFARVADFEQKYSRFIPGNWLDHINQDGKKGIELDDEAIRLIRFSLYLAYKTGGAFDPTIISVLEGYGYDANYSFVKKNPSLHGYIHVDMQDTRLVLHNGVKIEFGAIGKGYLLDVVANMLIEAGFEHFLIDFGGDIFAKGGYTIGLENPFDLTQLIGTINVDGYAVASSNARKRTVGDFHHLLDAHTGMPVRDIAAVYIAASTGLLADAYSTAVFVSGAEHGRKLLFETPEITGLLVFSDGSYRKKDGYPGELFL